MRNVSNTSEIRPVKSELNSLINEDTNNRKIKENMQV